MNEQTDLLRILLYEVRNLRYDIGRLRVTVGIQAGLDKQRDEEQMATIDEVLATVQDEDTKTDSLIALFDGLKQQLADILSGTKLPPAVQEKVDAIFNTASANAAQISAAIDSTPAP